MSINYLRNSKLYTLCAGTRHKKPTNFPSGYSVSTNEHRTLWKRRRHSLDRYSCYLNCSTSQKTCYVSGQMDRHILHLTPQWKRMRALPLNALRLILKPFETTTEHICVSILSRTQSGAWNDRNVSGANYNWRADDNTWT